MYGSMSSLANTEGSASDGEEPDTLENTGYPESTGKEKCFICETVRETDGRAYNQGGLKKCSASELALRLLQRKKIFIALEDHYMHAAALRLERILSEAHDIFAAGVYIHKSCYACFAVNPVGIKSPEQMEEEKKTDVLAWFEYKIRTRIIRDKEAFLLEELMNDIDSWSLEQGIQQLPIRTKKAIRLHLESKFPDQLGFFSYSDNKSVIVHASDMNPCVYDPVELRGCGLRDLHVPRAFGKLVRAKLLDTDDKLVGNQPGMRENISADMFNAVYFSLHDSGSMDEDGYAVTTEEEYRKIVSLVSSWKNLLSGTSREMAPTIDRSRWFFYEDEYVII